MWPNCAWLGLARDKLQDWQGRQLFGALRHEQADNKSIKLSNQLHCTPLYPLTGYVQHYSKNYREEKEASSKHVELAQDEENIPVCKPEKKENKKRLNVQIGGDKAVELLAKSQSNAIKLGVDPWFASICLGSLVFETILRYF